MIVVGCSLPSVFSGTSTFSDKACMVLHIYCRYNLGFWSGADTGIDKIVFRLPFALGQSSLQVGGHRARDVTGLASLERGHLPHFFFCQVAEAVLTSQLKPHQEKSNLIIKTPKVICFARPVLLECLGGLPSVLLVFS